jgi:hypothetical protein
VVSSGGVVFFYVVMQAVVEFVVVNFCDLRVALFLVVILYRRAFCCGGQSRLTSALMRCFTVLLSIKYCYCGQIEEDEMDGKAYFQYLGVDGMVIVKSSFKKRMGGYGLDSRHLR